MTNLLAAVLGLATIAAFLLGRYHWPRHPDIDDQLDDAYAEGWDDAKADLHRMWQEDQNEASVAGVPAVSSVVPAADWLTATHEQLSPEHIHEPAIDMGYMSLPADVQEDIEAAADWPTDTRLPSILALGTPGDGTPNTFKRWQLAQWDWTARIRDDEERIERELAWGRVA